MKSGRDKKAIEKDIKILRNFIGVYCRQKHSGKSELCLSCKELLGYGINKLKRCPYNPKPKCKACETHCYLPLMRQKIREVMKFSGMYYAKRGRIDWLIKYFA